MSGLHCTTCTCEPAPEDLIGQPWKGHPIDRNPYNGKSYCPARWHPEGDTTYACHLGLSCLIEGHHDGPHQDYVLVPCTSCGAWGDHTQWCEVCEDEHAEWLRRKEAGNPELPSRYVTIRFEMSGPQDEPTYWTEPAP